VRHRNSLALVFLVLSAGSITRADEQTKSYPIGDAGSLNIALPDGWSATTNGRKQPTVSLLAPRDKQVSVQITPLTDDITDSKLQDAAEAVAQRYADRSKEKKSNPQEVKSDHVRGLVSSFTSAVAGSNDYACATAGVVVCDKQTLAIIVLYPEQSSAERAVAMKLIEHLTITAPRPVAKEIAFKSPDGKWSIVVPGQWKLSEDNASKDGKSRQATAISNDGTLVLTVFFDPAASDGDSAAARDFSVARMKKFPQLMQHLKQDTVGDFATLEYDQGTAGFVDHNVNAYLSHEGVWVDIHISKTDYNEKTDKPAFDSMIKGLKRQ
jgi:hypothetical protein